MNSHKTFNKLIIPLLVGVFTLSSCSQSQVEPSKKVTSSIGATVNNGGGKPSTGTISDSGSSKVNTSGSRGAHGDSANFNYLPSQGTNSGEGDITLAGLKDPNNLLSQRIIYFDYDKATIRPEYLVLINTHAKLAAKYPQLQMRLEGHADERGSREYNVALSAERAKSVKQIMGTQGARGNQIRTIGYGEEVPIVAGQGERSWQKNRRVEIKYNQDLLQ